MVQLAARRARRSETKSRPLCAWPNSKNGSPEFTLITQNVDGLHELAGSQNILTAARERLGGSLSRLPGEVRRPANPNARNPAQVRLRRAAAARPWSGLASRCRPGIWKAAEAAARASDLFLVIGTSAVVYPAAGSGANGQIVPARAWWKSISRKRRSPGEIDQFLQGPSGELLPQLIA